MKMEKNQKNRHGERGNVLFLILIAVALFAALSYAVTQSSRSGGGDAAGETNLVNSSTLTQYPAGLRTAIVRMIVSNGVTVDTLAFDTASDFGALSDPTRAVFHPSGGGATYAQSPADTMSLGGAAGTWYFNANFDIPRLGTDGAGGNELLAFLPGVSRALCLRLNEEYGVSTGTQAASPNNGVPLVVLTDANVLDNQVEGDAFPDTNQEDINNATNDTRAQPFGCVFDATLDPDGAGSAGAGAYIYYHVLIER